MRHKACTWFSSGGSGIPANCSGGISYFKSLADSCRLEDLKSAVSSFLDKHHRHREFLPIILRSVAQANDVASVEAAVWSLGYDCLLQPIYVGATRRLMTIGWAFWPTLRTSHCFPLIFRRQPLQGVNTH